MGRNKKQAPKRPSSLIQQGDRAADAGFFLKVVGVWFNGTILDTNDISTTRGASLGLLFTPNALEAALRAEYQASHIITQIISGASNLVLGFTPKQSSAVTAAIVRRFAHNYLTKAQNLAAPDTNNGPDTPNAKGSATLDLSHLRFSISTADKAIGEVAPDALAALNARAAVNQYQTLSCVRYAPATDIGKRNKQVVCALDRVSPTVGKDATSIVSASVKARRIFGRERKKDFFLNVLRDANIAGKDALLERLSHSEFSQSLHDLTLQQNDHPSLSQLPQNLANKLAIIHLDGNKFGQYLNRPLIEDRALFSAQLRVHQANLLCALLEQFLPEGRTTAADNPLIVRAGEDEELNIDLPERIRLEILLWGGDEIALAVPAWFGLEVMEILDTALRSFHITWQDGTQEALTHALGLCFCPYKTPIRSMRALAGNLADGAKNAGSSKFAYNIAQIESMDTDPYAIIEHRKKALGGLPKNQHLYWAEDANSADWRAIHVSLKYLFSEVTASRAGHLLAFQSSIAKQDDKQKAAKPRTLDGEMARLWGSEAKASEIAAFLKSDLFNKNIELALKWRLYLDGFVNPLNAFSPAHAEAEEV